MDKIKFSDLTTSLRVLIILGWIMAGLFGLSFLIGFTEGFLSI